MAGGNGEAAVERLTRRYDAMLAQRTMGLSTRGRHRLTASSTQLSDGNNISAAAKTTNPSNTVVREQDQAWSVYDRLGEVTTLVEGTAGLLSQCRFYVGARVTVGEKVLDKPITALSGITQRDAAAVTALWGRFTDESGSQAGLVRAVAQNWSVVAHCRLVGYVTDTEGQPVSPPRDMADLPEGFTEVWQAVAPTSLTLESEHKREWKLALTRNESVVLTRPVVYDLRWSHPRFPNEALGWVMAALDICRDLRVFTMAQRSAARSGIPADLLLAPLEANPKKPAQLGFEATDPEAPDPQDAADSFAVEIEAMIGEFIMDVINDTDAGTGVVPGVLAVGQDFIEKFQKISFARAVDRGLGELVNQARDRLAEVADCPPEMLRGLGTTNRWNGGQIADDEYRRYFRPKANAIADAFTAGPFRNGMRAAGLADLMDRLELRILVDPSEAVASPDYSKLVGLLLDRGVIGPSGALALLSLPESLAPTPAEIAFMEKWKKAGAPQQADNPGKGDQGPPSGDSDTDETKGAIMATHVRPIMALAAETLTLGDRLLAVEHTARGRLEEACEAALDRAVDRAHAKLRNWARKARVDWVIGVDSELSRLQARQLAADNPLTKAEMWQAALNNLRTSFERIARDAFVQAQQAIGQTLPPAEVDAAIVRAGDALIDGMMELADDEVFGTPVPTEGEVSPLRVPPVLVRKVLAIAGGAFGVSSGLDPDENAAFGLTLGPLLDRITPDWDELEWVYGDAYRQKHFQPHQGLDGQTFNGPQDPRLLQDMFSTFTHWAPGDHRGCLCSWRISFATTP